MTMFKRILCNHEFKRVYGIYGDEINHISLKAVYRSVWRCEKCDKLMLSKSLDKLDTEK